MISSETKITELKPKTFQIPECLGACINVRLFPEAVESAFSCKHHSYPVVLCVSTLQDMQRYQDSHPHVSIGLSEIPYVGFSHYTASNANTHQLS